VASVSATNNNTLKVNPVKPVPGRKISPNVTAQGQYGQQTPAILSNENKTAIDRNKTPVSTGLIRTGS